MSAELIRGLSKLFTHKPVSGVQASQMKALIAAYAEELQDIPYVYVSHALRDIVRDEREKFAPGVAVIRTRAAEYVRRHRRMLEGKRPEAYLPSGTPQLHVEREIQSAGDVLRGMNLLEGGTPEPTEESR